MLDGQRYYTVGVTASTAFPYLADPVFLPQLLELDQEKGLCGPSVMAWGEEGCFCGRCQTCHVVIAKSGGVFVIVS